MAERLRVEHLIKKYPGVVAVNDVSFSLNDGEVLALLGENGAGKSTLSKMICGVEKPNTGCIFLCGEEAHLNSALDAMNRGVAMVHQELSMVGEMSVAENVFGEEHADRTISKDYAFEVRDLSAKELYHDADSFLLQGRKAVSHVLCGRPVRYYLRNLQSQL